MAQLILREVSIRYGAQPLLDGVDLKVEAGDRICILGRNGAGKSTLLRLMARELEPDSGTIETSPELRLGTLPQVVPEGLAGSAREVVAEAVVDGEEAARRVEMALSRLDIDPETPTGSMSAGSLRRVLLARALAAEPDVLLLDEPTNHFDIPTIQRLEALLEKFRGTLLFVSHDRAFVKRLARRIVEVDRGRLHVVEGDYEEYLRRREALEQTEARAAGRLDRKLAAEEAWRRQGIKARGTRNEGRVRALERLREQRQARREQMGRVRLDPAIAKRSGRLVLEAVGVRASHDRRTVVDDLSLLLLRGDKLGVLGPNGCGKTTVIRLLLGELEPDAGEVSRGTRVEVAYFDQLRKELDLERSVRENVADGADLLTVRGRTRHVVSYLEEFLFPPERSDTPVSVLSGGERNRLLLARLFLKPSNLLVMDEPTNDLDIETLELLEQELADYPGTVIVASHDRTFLDRVVTSSLVWEEPGKFVEYAGGYSDWLLQRRESDPAPEGRASRKQKPRKESPRRLTFKERAELDALPPEIEALESERDRLHQDLSDPTFYQESGDRVSCHQSRLEEIAKELERAYNRWQELEDIAE